MAGGARAGPLARALPPCHPRQQWPARRRQAPARLAREAGFRDVTSSSSTWLHATPESRAAWAESWSGRITSAPLADQLEREGWADETERAQIAEAFHTWAQDPGGWFSLLHGEILARA